MSRYTFQVHMPQLVAAFIPMTTVPGIMSSLLREHHKVQWPITTVMILVAVVGIALLILYGFRKYPFIIENSGITVIKRRITPEDIVSIRLRRTALTIMTNTWRARGVVTIDKADLRSVTQALREFTDVHGIHLELK